MTLRKFYCPQVLRNMLYLACKQRDSSGSSYVYSDYTFRRSIERCATHLQGAMRRVRKVY